MLRPRRLLWRALQALAALSLLSIGVVFVAGYRSFGQRARGARRARMEQSANWRGGHFVNPQPLVNSGWLALRGAFKRSPDGRPAGAVPTVPDDRARFAAPPPSGLRVTWLGHSSTLVEIEGHRLLTDPVWGLRASPLAWAGPRRWYPPPLALGDLPPIDAVVISHDHYDHLDRATITAMKDWPTTFVVPLGVGADLAAWGIPEARIVELDWWERTSVHGLTIVCTPARHASGRMIVDNDAKLWAGYAFIGDQHRVYFSGDTGLFPAMRDIGARLGPFDLTMIEAGQYNPAWPDWHIGPEQAVRAHQLVRGRLLLPIHWGLFRLAYHAWTEPPERVLAAAKLAGVGVVVPRPGASFEPATPPPPQRWWPALPWNTAAQEPIVSSQMDGG
jgi:L-ascorbate metabolism protein UlaG (beta-lactamase superfamily)